MSNNFYIYLIITSIATVILGAFHPNYTMLVLTVLILITNFLIFVLLLHISDFRGSNKSKIFISIDTQKRKKKKRKNNFKNNFKSKK
jgi:hypothetical protein